MIVIDNAPIHTNKAFKAKIREWKEKKLEIFWLPTYSPQLNLIEILWRFMKYEWIETEAYFSWQNMKKYVEQILRDFGNRYVINFAYVLTVMKQILSTTPKQQSLQTKI